MPYDPITSRRPGIGGYSGAPDDVTPNNFVPTAKGLASEVELYTVYERPIPQMTYLFDRHVGYVGFSTLLNAMGFKHATSTPTLGHYENPWKEDFVKFGAITAGSDFTGGAGGESGALPLDPISMYDTSTTAGGTALQASYVQVGDVLELPSGIQVQVTDKTDPGGGSPHTIKIKPLDSTVDLADVDGGGTPALATGDEVGIGYNLWAEGSGLPQGRAPRIIKYSNTLATIKHSFGATGHELTNSLYHEAIAGQESTVGESIYVHIRADELYRYEMSKSHLLLFGQQADNLTQTVESTGLDTPISSSEGLIPFALTSGSIDEVTLASYTIEDFDTIANIYYDERVAIAPDILCLDGPEMATATENAFTNTLEQNLIHTVDRLIDGYAGFMSNMYHEGLDAKPTDATLSFGYSAIQKNGFIFHLKRMSEFNDIKRFGSTSYGYRKFRLAMPVGWTQDLLSGNSRSTIGYEYKALGAYSRENLFGHLPGAGVGADNSPFGRAIDQYDRMTYFLLCHMGGHWAVGNGLVVQREA